MTDKEKVKAIIAAIENIHFILCKGQWDGTHNDLVEWILKETKAIAKKRND